ncbi:hypothetical protein RRG08_009483 [Elysia crispata]|uniref:Selenoprotein K n=1 Tax=Elysia crispata TaxID=231223 RepID=A0AAE1E3L9_9GAST|nr:hypothetical protein RRG08_009483 [Elysia crispata]
MPYISNGQVVESRSPWRLSFITDLFWGIINFVVLFFQTLVDPSKNSKGNRYTSDYRRPGSGPGGGPGGPRRRMGGIGGDRGGPNPPPMAGGG